MSEKIEINKDLRDANQGYALANREYFAKRGIRALNLMSSPGSGKTTLLEKTAAAYKGRKLAVLVGDIATERDAERVRLAAAGVRAEQIVTEDYGSACHLDARMVAEALPRLAPEEGSLLVIENVGNLVCPAGLYLGEERRVVLLSLPEGDDKVKKYPVIFRAADLLLISKCDLAGACAFDADKVEREAREIKGDLEVLRISSKTGEGMDAWFGWLNSMFEIRGSK